MLHRYFCPSGARSVFTWLGLVSLILVSCRGSNPLNALPGPKIQVTEAQSNSLFVPPTQPPPTSTSTPPVALQQPSTPAPPDCSNNLLYVSDMSIPDGAIVNPGQRLDKRWDVENNGSCNWDQTYRVKLIAGPEMGVPAEQSLYPARSGTHATIRIVFTAPQEPGTYRSAWQAFDPQGQPFGDPFYIEVVVEQPQQ